MADDLARLGVARTPTPAQPLIGVTILAVEDSRFASEAVRLMAMRLGARLRRADCLASARRHLAVYPPSVVLVDLGLPDGCGSDLIAELRTSDVPPPAILVMSGDPEAAARAEAAGADGTLLKPLGNLATFEAAILAHLPPDRVPKGPRPVQEHRVQPDDLALKDDLTVAADVLASDATDIDVDYAAQFVASVAHSARDIALADAARHLAARRAQGGCAQDARGELSRIVQDRLAESRPI